MTVLRVQYAKTKCHRTLDSLVDGPMNTIGLMMGTNSYTATCGGRGSHMTGMRQQGGGGGGGGGGESTHQVSRRFPTL